MYGKVFESMFDGTLASRGPWQALVTFQQMIVLANKDGMVDMTPEAISRRTSIPLDIIELGISELMKPDARSRTPDEDGRRIVLIDDHRDWGWQIVNHAKYQAIRNAEERREYLRVAQANRRARLKAEAASTTVNTVNRLSAKVNTSTPASESATADREVPTVLVAKGDAYSAPPCPFQDLVSSYHQNCPSLPKVRVITNMRMKHARARWVEVCVDEKWGAEQALAWFRDFFKTVEQSDFLTGRRGSKDRVWKADFEWLMTAGNFAKVVEGRYAKERA